MPQSNLAQHERYLKQLETSLKDICDAHKQIDDLLRHSWTLALHLFVVGDQLRTTRCEFEKDAQDA